MIKILINNTQSNIAISDVGVTVLTTENYIIPPQDYLHWIDSSDIVTQVGNGNITVNDGSKNLTAAEGIALIQGNYPTQIKLLGADGTPLGNNGDKLKIEGAFSVSSNPSDASGSPVFTPKYRIIYDNTKIDLPKNNEIYHELYTYSGSGKLSSFTLNFNSNDIMVKLTIDSQTIFEVDCDILDDILEVNGNDEESTISTAYEIGWNENKKRLNFFPRHSIYFTTNIKIEVKASTNSSSKDLNSYLINLTQET